MAGCVERTVKQPCAMRLVTLIVLTLADLDFFLSILFLVNLTHHYHDKIYYTIGPWIIGAGICTYAIGIAYFGPQQRRRVMDNVLKLMQSNPQEFESPNYRERTPGQYVPSREAHRQGQTLHKVLVGVETPVHPASPPGSGNRKIGELNRWDGADQEKFKKGLAAWGLGYIWEAAELKNSWNCTSPVHGIPMVRLARFGFMSQPSPTDLGGLLNANALYSFATGFFQLFLGTLMLADFGWSLETGIPLCVSLLSLLLCLTNVIWDFAQLLMKIDMEERQAATILDKNRAAKKAELDELASKRDQKIEEIKMRYAQAGKEVDSQTKLQMQLSEEQEKNHVIAHFDHVRSTVNERYAQDQELEMVAWQRNLAREQELLKGGSQQIQHTAPGPLADAMHRQEIITEHQSKIDRWFNEELKKLDVDSISVDEYRAKLQQLRTGKREKEDALNELKESLLGDRC